MVCLSPGGAGEREELGVRRRRRRCRRWWIRHEVSGVCTPRTSGWGHRDRIVRASEQADGLTRYGLGQGVCVSVGECERGD